jgi:hypothetical protein
MAAPASADPKDGLFVTSVCDNGETYETVAKPAPWNAQLVIDETQVFILTSVQFNFVVTDPSGTVVNEGSFPTDEKGNSEGRHETLNCTFSYSFLQDSGNLVTAFGLVTGFVAPSG